MNKRKKGYCSLLPQLPQNLFVERFSALHFEQLIFSGFIGEPQLPQNFIVSGIEAPHFGQITLATGARLFPQLPQNLAPTLFWLPQFEHNTTC